MLLFLFGITTIQAQSVLEQWTTIDDATGKAKSVVKIYQDKGKLFGKVVEIIDKTKQDKICDKCKGENKNQPVKGILLLKTLKQMVILGKVAPF